MKVRRVALLLAVLMGGASLAAVVARPTTKISSQGPALVLEDIVPHQFGDWREMPKMVQQVVNPQTQELLDKLYSQILSRTYVNGDGYRVMLSIAYGTDQRGGLEAHKPEVCYPAQGFKLARNVAMPVVTPYGEIPAQRLFTTLGVRQEPITYWFTVGEKNVQTSTQKRLVALIYGLTGRIPDGLLFRVSSIDGDEVRADQMHDRFINELLASVPAPDRLRLSGLGGEPK